MKKTRYYGQPVATVADHQHDWNHKVSLTIRLLMWRHIRLLLWWTSKSFSKLKL